jgi:MerR family transcriptional regulator, redox-sensitive transcriptional activator SoxR
MVCPTLQYLEVSGSIWTTAACRFQSDGGRAEAWLRTVASVAVELGFKSRGDPVTRNHGGRVRGELSGDASTRLSIGEIAQRAGLRASAVRYYERMGVLPPPRREGGRRVYDEVVLDRLALVRFAQQAGYTLAEVRELVRTSPDVPPAVRWRHRAMAKRAEIDALIGRAHAMRAALDRAADCRCRTLEECGRTAAACKSA